MKTNIKRVLLYIATCLLGVLLISAPQTALATETSPQDLSNKIIDLLVALDTRLNHEVVSVIKSHQTIIDSSAIYLEEIYTTDWNGIILHNGTPRWSAPENWQGFWQLSSATSLLSGKPNSDTHWPLVSNPGLIEMITMDLQYLEGVNYAVDSGSLYFDALVSVSFEWFSALYREDYSALVPLAERVSGVYVMQHNLLSLTKGNASRLDCSFILTGDSRLGTVKFTQDTLVTYQEVLAALLAISASDINELHLSAEAIAKLEKLPVTTPVDPINPNKPVDRGDSDPLAADNSRGNPNTWVFILWPLSLLGAVAIAYIIGCRRQFAHDSTPV